MVGNSQKFIARNRAPRVQIEYDVELYGAEKKVQLPFVMGVLSDLAGKSAVPQPPVQDRAFLEIDVDNFDARMKAMQPRAAFSVPNTLTGEGNLPVDLTFEQISDFEPAAIARKVEPLRQLLQARTELADLMTYMDGKSGAETLIETILQNPDLLRSLSAAARPDAAAPPTGAALDALRAAVAADAAAEETPDATLEALRAATPPEPTADETTDATLDALRGATPTDAPAADNETAALDALRNAASKEAPAADDPSATLDALAARAPEEPTVADAGAAALDALRSAAPAGAPTDAPAADNGTAALDALHNAATKEAPAVDDPSATLEALAAHAPNETPKDTDDTTALNALRMRAVEGAPVSDDQAAALETLTGQVVGETHAEDLSGTALDAPGVQTPADTPAEDSTATALDALRDTAPAPVFPAEGQAAALETLAAQAPAERCEDDNTDALETLRDGAVPQVAADKDPAAVLTTLAGQEVSETLAEDSVEAALDALAVQRPQVTTGGDTTAATLQDLADLFPPDAPAEEHSATALETLAELQPTDAPAAGPEIQAPGREGLNLDDLGLDDLVIEDLGLDNPAGVVLASDTPGPEDTITGSALTKDPGPEMRAPEPAVPDTLAVDDPGLDDLALDTLGLDDLALDTLGDDTPGAEGGAGGGVEDRPEPAPEMAENDGPGADNLVADLMVSGDAAAAADPADNSTPGYTRADSAVSPVPAPVASATASAAGTGAETVPATEPGLAAWGPEAAGLQHSTQDETGPDDPGLDALGLDELGLDDLGVDDPGLDDPGLVDLGLDDLGLDDPGLDDPGLELQKPDDLPPDDLPPDDLPPDDLPPDDLPPDDLPPDDLPPDDLPPDDARPYDAGRVPAGLQGLDAAVTGQTETGTASQVNTPPDDSTLGDTRQVNTPPIDTGLDDSTLDDSAPDAAAMASAAGAAEPQHPYGALSTPRPDREQLRRKRFRIALFGDFSGRAARRLCQTGAALAARKAIPLDVDTVEDVIESFATTLVLQLGRDGSGVEIRLNGIDDLHPDELYDNVELFSALNALKQQLGSGATADSALRELKAWGEAFSTPIVAPKRSSAATAVPADRRLSAFQQLIGDTSASLSQPSEVQDLLARIMGPYVVAAEAPEVTGMKAAVDAALTSAMRLVLHHPEFQALESQWRALDFLARRIETDDDLDLVLYDISAEELAADLAGAADLADSGLLQLLTGDPLEEENGRGGYSALIGMYSFEETPPHAELLGRIARLAAHVDAPFFAAIAPGFIDTKKPDRHPLVARAWEALRAMPEAGYLGLATPRFLLRHPYGARSDPVYAFPFEEFTMQAGLSSLLWANPVLLIATLLAKSWQEGGAQMSLGSVMSLGDIPYHFVTDAYGDQIALPCTERNLSTSATEIVVTRGLMPVLSLKGQDTVRLGSFQSLAGQEILGRWAGETPAPPSAPDLPAATLSMEIEVPPGAAAADGAGTGGDLDDLLAGFDDTTTTPTDPDAVDEDLAALLEGL
jgi:pilus assembly protein FimV